MSSSSSLTSGLSRQRMDVLMQDAPARLPPDPNNFRSASRHPPIKMPGHTDIQTLSSLSTHEHDQSQRKRPLQDNGRDKLDTDRFNTTSARPRSHSRSRSPSRKKRATGRDTPPSCSSSSSSRSIPTGPRRSDQSSDRYRRSRSPLLPQSAINRRKEKRREVSPGDGYSRRVSGDRSRPTSPTSSFISSTHDFHSALPMRAQSRFGPPVNNGLQLPGDVTTTDPRCPPIELATDVIARQLALHEGLIKAEGTGVTEAYTENDVQREGTGVIYPRSRSSSSQVKSPVVTIEPSSSMEEHVMKTEAVPSPELLQVPQGNRDLRQPSDAFDDTDMKISPIREPVKLQPNTSPASPASPLVIPNVEPTIVTPQIPITVSNSESVRDRPSSLPRQISPPYIKQVRRLSVVGLGSDQVSLSPTISVASLPSSSTPQQRRFPSDERPLLPDVAQSIDVLVGSFSKAVRYRWDYDQISIQIFNNERKLQTLPPSLPIVPSTKSVDPRLAINQKKQSPQPEVEPPLSERELTENKIARLLKDQAVAQTKLRDEMGKIQRHVQSCYNATRNDFVEGVARSQTETKDIVEGVLLAIAGPKNESMGLGLHIAGGDVASAVVRNEGDALGPISPAPPVSTTVGDANSARLDHLEVEFNEQFALLSEQCRVAFDTLKEDRNEVVNTFENRFDSLNKLFVSGAEFKQFRDSLGQLKKLLEAVVIVDQSRSEEAKVLSNVVKDVNTRISAMERQLKAQQQQSQSLINEGNATTAVKGETATKSTASSVIQPDPQVASHVQELQKEIANLVTDNARLRSEIEQCVEASRSEAQKHENEVEALKREVGGLKSENAQNREQFIATVEGYQAEMTRIGNSMSVLAAIATGNPGFDYLRAHLGNIVVGNNVVAGAGSNDPTGHNSVQPTSFPLALPVPPSGDRGGVESRNAVQKPSLSDGLSGVDVGRISGDDSAVIFKVED